MIAVIFEVQPHAAQRDRYFELAAALRDDLQRVDGFISVERFESLTRPGHLLSLSFWRDEEAVRRWRQHAPHREAQLEGRSTAFATYRLRVAEVVRDYGDTHRAQAPQDAQG